MFKVILTIGFIQVIAIAVNLVRTKVVAVMLGPEGVGVISTIDQVVQSVSYFTALSLPFASVKFLSRAHSEGDEELRRTYAGFLKGLVALSLGGTIVAASLVIFRPEIFGQAVLKYRTLVFVALLGVPAMILGGYFTQVLAAVQKFRQSSLLAVFTNSTTTAAIIIGVIFAGVLGLYIGIVTAGVLVTAAVLIYLRRSFGLPLFDRGASFIGELRRNPSIISFSFLVYVATLSLSFGFVVVRYTTLKSYGEAEAGFLQAAIAISLAVGLVLNPTNGLFLTPIMNRNIGRSEKMHAAGEFEKKLLIVLCLVSLPIVLFPDLVITVLFSAKFTTVAGLVYVFIISQCLTQLAGVHQALLIGFDDLKAYSVITCAGHLSLGLLAWLLVPQMGVFGAAVAFVTAYTFLFVATLARLKVSHGFAMPRHFWLIGAYGLAALLTAGIFVGRMASLDPETFILKTAILLFFGLGFLLCLDKEDLNSLFVAFGKFKMKRSET